MPRILTLLLALFVVPFLSGNGAWAAEDSTFRILENNSVVGVTGRLSGTGIIVLYDQQPAILTSSHILEGMDSAILDLGGHPNGGRQTAGALRARVVFDSPADDIALLSLPLNLDARARARFFARAAAALCSSKSLDDQSCMGAAAFRSSTLDQGFDHVDIVDIVKRTKGRSASNSDTISLSVARSVPLLAPWPFSFVQDAFISGYYGRIIALPIFLRPGASGGAFYAHGIFVGLLTKVSSSAEPIAFAIPLDEIQTVLTRKPRGSWIGSKAGYRLQVIDGPDVLFSGVRNEGYVSAGGETTNGGGETTNGGGETTNGGNTRGHPYWQIQVRQYVDVSHGETAPSIQASLRYVETLNPFLDPTSETVLNGRRVSYLRTADNDNRPRLVAASSAAYLWHKRSDPNFSIVYETSESFSELPRLRRLNNAELKFGRLYSALGLASYQLINNNCDTKVGDAAQALFSRFDLAPALIGLTSARTSVLVDSGCKQNKTSSRPGADGFFHGRPFSSKTEPDGSNTFLFRSDRVATEVNVARNFGMITIRDIHNQVANVAISLSPVPSHSPATVLYAPLGPQSGYHAVAIYDTDDLTKLTRLFVQIPGHQIFGESMNGSLVELVACEPGKDCFR